MSPERPIRPQPHRPRNHRGVLPSPRAHSRRKKSRSPVVSKSAAPLAKNSLYYCHRTLLPGGYHARNQTRVCAGIGCGCGLPRRARNAAPRSAPARLSRPAGASRETESCRRAAVERLYQLTSELRDEVQKTVTSDVLSIRMYKKTEEIEKLVKQIKSKAKG